MVLYYLHYRTVVLVQVLKETMHLQRTVLSVYCGSTVPPWLTAGCYVLEYKTSTQCNQQNIDLTTVQSVVKVLVHEQGTNAVILVCTLS
jgi:hypothetical protein